MHGFAALALILFPTTPAGAQKRPTVEDRDACIVSVVEQFVATINDFVQTAKTERGSGSYAAAGNPKSFALCIDWGRSTSRVRRGTGYGFATGADRPDSRALDWCREGKGSKDGTCQCEIVHRNGFAAISFPNGWLEQQCR
jgi:hypothetical protein